MNNILLSIVGGGIISIIGYFVLRTYHFIRGHPSDLHDKYSLSPIRIMILIGTNIVLVYTVFFLIPQVEISASSRYGTFTRWAVLFVFELLLLDGLRS